MSTATVSPANNSTPPRLIRCRVNKNFPFKCKRQRWIIHELRCLCACIVDLVTTVCCFQRVGTKYSTNIWTFSWVRVCSWTGLMCYTVFPSDKPQKSCQKTKVSFKYVLLSVFLSSCYLPIAHTPNITSMGFLHFSSGHNTSL